MTRPRRMRPVEAMAALATWEREHEARFGHPYVYEEPGICATCEHEMAAWIEAGDAEDDEEASTSDHDAVHLATRATEAVVRRRGP